MINKITTFLIAAQMVITVLIVIVLMTLFNSRHRDIRRYWARLQRHLIGYKIEVIGQIDPTAQLLIINHQSMADIMVLEDLHPSDLCWIAKKEIGQIPIIGLILKLPKMIAIDRQNARALPALIKEVQNRVENGRVVAIFPEGTRGPGVKLLKFHPGAKMIAEKLHLKVQPVAISGTNIIVDAKKFSIKKGPVRLTYLPPCDLSDPQWFENAKISIQEHI